MTFLNKFIALELYFTMEKLWDYGKKNMVLWKKLWYYGQVYETMEKILFYIENCGFTKEQNMVLYQKVRKFDL